MNWRLKSMLRHLLLAGPGGSRRYRWLTVRVLGTNAGMARKWFRVLPSRLELLQQAFGPRARAQRLWCFDSGATIAAGLAMAVASDAPGLLTDRADRLADRYCAVCRRVLEEKGPELAALSAAPPDRVAEVLAATEGRDARAALGALNLSYSASHAAAEDAEWRGAAGCIFSGGTLEHYRPEELEAEVARMGQALRPGGVMSHVVDHRDHRWHADKRLSPLAHLTIGEEAFGRRFGNPLEYHNRWLRSDYLALFSRLGFSPEARDVITYTPDLPPLDHRTLAAPFADRDETDLRSLVTHFVVRRE
jgi:SAM-dependent methyltransferase